MKAFKLNRMNYRTQMNLLLFAIGMLFVLGGIGGRSKMRIPLPSIFKKAYISMPTGAMLMFLSTLFG